MKANSISILRQLTSSEDIVDERVLGVLADERTESELREPDPGATIHQTLGIWRRRLKASETVGHSLVGAEALVNRLQLMKAQQAKITQVNFRNDQYACVLFFERANMRFVGSVLSERRSESKEERASTAFAQRNDDPHLTRKPVLLGSSRYFKQA